jgi:hypothetical protein
METSSSWQRPVTGNAMTLDFRKRGLGWGRIVVAGQQLQPKRGASQKKQIYTSMFFDTIFGIAACLCASVLVMSVQCGFSVAIDFKEST